MTMIAELVDSYSCNGRNLDSRNSSNMPKHMRIDVTIYCNNKIIGSDKNESASLVYEGQP